MKQSISKVRLWNLINQKIDNSIQKVHVGAILLILMFEIIKDLKNGKKVKIENFGTFDTVIKNRGKSINISTGKLESFPPKKRITFEIQPKLFIFLKKNLDKVKTIKG